MDPRTRNLFVITIVAIVALIGAAAVLFGGPGRPDASPPPDAQQMVGVIVGVQATSLTDVQGFTLRTNIGWRDTNIADAATTRCSTSPTNGTHSGGYWEPRYNRCPTCSGW